MRARLLTPSQRFTAFQLRSLQKKPGSQLVGMHRKDGVSPDCLVVYRNNLLNYVYLINLCLHPMVIASVLIGTHNIYSAWAEKGYCDLVTLMNADQAFNSVCYLALAILIILMSRGISHRTIVRLYYNEAKQRYHAVLRSRNMVSTYVMDFVPGDVTERKAGAMMGQFRGNFTIKGRPFVINSADFRNPFHYNLMVGNIEPKEDEKLE